MPLLNLPEPVGWRTNGRRLLWVTAIVTLFVVVGLAVAAWNLARGDFLSALVLFGIFAPFVMVLVAVHRVARGRTVLRPSVDSTGTTLHADRVFSVLMTVVLVDVIAVGVLVVVTTLSGDLGLFTSARARIVALVLMGAATAIAGWGLISAGRRGGIGHVKLTTGGVEVADIARTTLVPWQDLIAVADRAESKKTRKAVVLRRSDGTETTIDGADFYVPNGAALYWMLRHYQSNADDRPELVDGRAMQRLAEGRFEVG